MLVDGSNIIGVKSIWLECPQENLVKLTGKKRKPHGAVKKAQVIKFNTLSISLLFMQSTYVDNSTTVDQARDYGHTHLSEVQSPVSSYDSYVAICELICISNSCIYFC